MSHRIRLLPAALLLAAACADDPTSLGAPRLRPDEAPADAVVAPDTIPGWAYADDNVVPLAAGRPDGAATLRDVVLVLFDASAPAGVRDSIVATVGGRVVGGRRTFGEDGVWLVQVPVDPADPAASVLRAADSLDTFAEVEAASPELMGPDGADWLAPRDDAAAGRWTVSPDSTTTDANWAFERVAAPLAWGCSTGDARTVVAVVDRGFAPLTDLVPNVLPNALPDEPASDGHGATVTSILAARGDNGAGIAGMMWRADVRSLTRTGLRRDPRATALLADASALADAVVGGARVVALAGALAPAPAAGDASGAERQRAFNERAAAFLAALLRRAERRGAVEPLYVFSAGNVRGDAETDAVWNTFPALRATFPERVLVVAASDRRDSLLASSRAGSLVDVAAPGEGVLSLDAEGALRASTGTSAAVPLAAGAAGLLFSFDPSLTAEQVRRLLVDGARAGGRVASEFPIVNAYEALQLASARPGAPLCGRRVWYDGESIVVDRDTSAFIEDAAERIPLALDGGTIRVVAPAEGGREIWFQHVDTSGTALMGRASLGDDGAWSVALDATAEWEASGAAALGRLRASSNRYYGSGGATRGGDSTLWLQATYAPGYSEDSSAPVVRRPWHVAMRDAAWITRLSAWAGSASDEAVGSGTHLADLWTAAAPDSTTPRDGAFSVTAAFDGAGGHAYVVVASTADTTGARLYRLPNESGPRELAALGVFPEWRELTHLAVSEDGRQLAVTYAPNDDTCVVEFRDARIPDRVLRASAMPYAACGTTPAAPNFAASKGRRSVARRSVGKR